MSPALRTVRRTVANALRQGLVHTVRRADASHRALPHLLVLGAQRAGTTSLWRSLCSHPQFVPPMLGLKGVHHQDLHATRPMWWYRAHFPRAERLRRHGAITGEANPYQLFHPRVPSAVAADLPEARFVVLLRDPVARAVSHYHHMRDEGHEPLPTLEAALEAEPTRLAGAHEALLAEPGLVHEHHLHHGYVARGHYADQLERWFAAVGRERVLVLPMAWLVSDPVALVAEVCRWAGIDPERATASRRRHNATSHPPTAPATLERLRAAFREPDERLWDLLGVRWW